MADSVPYRAVSPDLPVSVHVGQLDVLAERAAQGDRSAFGEIYELLVDDLYRYVRGQCRDETLAEDLVANVFFKAWRSASSYRRVSGQYRRWIFTIARNELRNHWRSAQRTVEILDHDLVDDGILVADGADAAREVVERALHTLTRAQRDVVVLRYFENKSHEEIAGILGKREGAVRALLLRALRRMRKVMADAAV